MRCVRSLVSVLSLLAVVAVGCGDDDESSSSTTTPNDDATQNACPVDGCELTITEVQPEGEELRITWEANFGPDFAKNHVHVFWDTYTADEVTNDAAARGETQGEWVPTGDYPEFVTEGPVSTEVRGDSTTICVTAANRDHDVLDSSIVDCRDVADSL